MALGFDRDEIAPNKPVRADALEERIEQMYATVDADGQVLEAHPTFTDAQRHANALNSGYLDEQ